MEHRLRGSNIYLIEAPKEKNRRNKRRNIQRHDAGYFPKLKSYNSSDWKSSPSTDQDQEKYLDPSLWNCRSSRRRGKSSEAPGACPIRAQRRHTQGSWGLGVVTSPSLSLEQGTSWAPNTRREPPPSGSVVQPGVQGSTHTHAVPGKGSLLGSSCAFRQVLYKNSQSHS